MKINPIVTSQQTPNKSDIVNQTAIIKHKAGRHYWFLSSPCDTFSNGLLHCSKQKLLNIVQSYKPCCDTPGALDSGSFHGRKSQLSSNIHHHCHSATECVTDATKSDTQSTPPQAQHYKRSCNTIRGCLPFFFRTGGKFLRLLICLLIALSAVRCDPRLDQIATFAGSGVPGSTGDGGQGTSAKLNSAWSVWGDTLGVMYISDSSNNKIRRVSTSGIITTFAGGGSGSSGDGGPLTSAGLNSPVQLINTNSTNSVLVITEYSGHKLRQLSVSTNTVTLLAGIGTSGTTNGDDGAATSATLWSPTGVAVDTAGNVYFSMWDGRRVRKIDANTKIISAYLGADGVTLASPVGTPASSAGMFNTCQIYIDFTSNILYVASYTYNRIYSVPLATGIMGVFAGGGSGSTGPATSASFSGLYGAWRDLFGNVFTTEFNTHKVRKINVAGIVSPLSGTGTGTYGGDGGPPTSASFFYLRMLGSDTLGYVYVADSLNNRVRKIYDYIPTAAPTVQPTAHPTAQPTAQPTTTPPRLDQITSVAGNGVQSVTAAAQNGDGGAATAGSMNSLYSVWGGDTLNTLYISDRSNNKIRRVDSAGIITTFAGTGVGGSTGNGGALTSAQFNYPIQFHGNSTSKVFVVAESSGCYVRQLNSNTNKVSTILGTSDTTSLGDGGPATSASSYFPYGVVVDTLGNVYVSEWGGNRVRKIDATTKIIFAFLGATGVNSVSTDGTQASSAGMTSPAQLYIDTSANVLYVAAFGLDRVCTVTISTGVMNIFAPSVSFSSPFGVWKDRFGNVFVSEVDLHRVRKISSSGIVSVISGTGTASTTGASTSAMIGDSGAPTSATFNTPRLIWVDSTGYVYIADQLNNRVREVYDYVPTAMPTTSPTLAPTKRLDEITSIAGNGVVGFMGDSGPATSASFNGPYSIWGDTQGVMYVSDNTNGRIRRIDLSGFISTFAGGGSISDDGASLTSASIVGIVQFYGNSTSRIWFVANSGGNKVQQLNGVSNTVSTLVGSGPATSTGDGGQATSATINNPNGVFTDTVGNIYTSEMAGNRVRRIDATTKFIYAYLGADGLTGQSSANTYASAAGMLHSAQLFIDTVSNLLYVASLGHNKVYYVTMSSGPLVYIAGTGTIETPFGLWKDRFGNVFITEQNQHRAKKVAVGTGTATVFVGTGTASAASASAAGNIGDGGPPNSATLFAPSMMFADSLGFVYIADLNNQRIRKIFDYTPTATPTPLPSIAPSCVPTIKPSTPTSQPSRQPSSKPTLQPSAQPSSRPSSQPYARPSRQPSSQPSVQPSTQPMSRPSSHPSSQPSTQPSKHPSSQPSLQPITQPSAQPSRQPTTQPSTFPSLQPSMQPSRHPSSQPNSGPSVQPTTRPSDQPSHKPSNQPTSQPFGRPSQQPTFQPSSMPSRKPSSLPTSQPSICPSMQPSATPSGQPSRQPSGCPSLQPTLQPSNQPTSQPTMHPSCQPSIQPSAQPTSQPTMHPSCRPSVQPSVQPICVPSLNPSTQPSGHPSKQPFSHPSCQPTVIPSAQPSSQPLVTPSNSPSSQPSRIPSYQPIGSPSSQPSIRPSAHPSSVPSTQPARIPTSQPSCAPSSQPSRQPSRQPSARPSSQPIASPSTLPSVSPTTQPSPQPNGQPSSLPSMAPTIRSVCSSKAPSAHPSSTSPPSVVPTIVVTTTSSSSPRNCPSSQPSLQPSSVPSVSPSSQPSSIPLNKPSSRPSRQPGSHPTSQPSRQPTSVPSARQVPLLSPLETRKPSRLPTMSPSAAPSASPTGRLPLHTDVSVLYASLYQVKFRFVLPFLFTSGVVGDDLVNVTVPNATKSGVNYIYLGNSFINQRELSVALLPTVHTDISYDFSGRSVSNGGDVNGDGHDDLIVGVPFASKCFVLFGTKRGFVNMTDGFTILGAAPSDLTGWSVSGAGDVNNDTFADVVIGAPYAGAQITGAAYVLYGKRGGFTLFDLGNLSPFDGYVIYGVSTSDCMGLSVSEAGDVNNDGFDDVIIGALRVNDAMSGAAYIVYGSLVKPTVALQLTLASTTGFTVLTGSTYSWFGYSVSGAGDVNNDTFADVVIGCVPRKAVLGIPFSYLVLGSKSVSLTNAIKITGGGVVVSGVGDINDNGFDDVMIVGRDYGFETGGGYVVTYPTQLPRTSLPPSMCPSIAPSWRPSTPPSFKPSILPTHPTVCPSVAPSGPTQDPTITPTQPTSHPSAVPTAPTVCPTVSPSLLPTVPPSCSPSKLPAAQPSQRPSPIPSIALTCEPTSRVPSHSPSATQSRLPTHYPVVYPTIIPTVFSTPQNTNITYHSVSVVIGGVYERPVNNYTNFVINATQDVTIAGTEGVVMFTVLPNQNTTLHIQSFKVKTDIINLRAFVSVHSLDQILSFSHRVLTAPIETYNYSVSLTLGDGQFIHIANISESELTPRQFRFSNTQEVPAIARMKRSYGPIIAASVVFGSLFLFIVWKFGEQVRHNYKIMQMMVVPIDWVENERSNPTYVSFNNDDSDSSLASNVSSLTNSSGAGSSDDDEEEEDDEDSQSVEHASPQGSVLEGSILSSRQEPLITRHINRAPESNDNLESKSSDGSHDTIVFADDDLQFEHEAQNVGVVQRHYAHHNNKSNNYDEKDSFEVDESSQIQVVIQRNESHSNINYSNYDQYDLSEDNIHNNNLYYHHQNQEQHSRNELNAFFNNHHQQQRDHDFTHQNYNSYEYNEQHPYDEEAHWE